MLIEYITFSPTGANVYGAVTNLNCPAGVPVCNGWMYLPDEVWLSILSLLPPRDLCRVVQVCRRLHTLATDHSLWKHLTVENSTLTEQWLLSVGKLRPHSLSLYSCSGLSVTSFGLEMFFTLCGNSLKVCPGLKQLNIGQVPKVNAHSLIMMASQLKCLISLNLTALQAVGSAPFIRLCQCPY
ncbi:hypothetical protein INR49_015564 [Caranx melampygus]|nr:hypothetical protein INR49_015564 [Caranx melampygus]